MAMKKRFYTMNSQMMAYDEGGVTKDFLTDHLGSITAEINQSQTRTYDTRYSAYGRNNWSTGTGCGFGWVGSYGYRETGLFHMSHYVRARHYSYLTGGWSTVDPLWPNESAYGYVGGTSTYSVDPSGTLPIMAGCGAASSDGNPNWGKRFREYLGKMCRTLQKPKDKGPLLECIRACNKKYKLEVDPTCLKDFCSKGSITCAPCPRDPDTCRACPPKCGGPCCVHLPSKAGSTQCVEKSPSNPILICTNSGLQKPCGCKEPIPGDTNTGSDLINTLFHEMAHACSPGCAFHPGKTQDQLNRWADCMAACVDVFGE